jgi:hypothetical protein
MQSAQTQHLTDMQVAWPRLVSASFQVPGRGFSLRGDLHVRELQAGGGQPADGQVV